MGKLTALKKPKIVLPFVILLAAAIVLAITIKNMNAPAQGSVTETPPSQAENIDPYSHPNNFTGKYISYSYPAHFKLLPTKLTGSYLQVDNYHSTDISAKQISIGVYRGNTDSDSGAVYRREHKDIYKENDSRLGVEFTKTDGTEDTFFIEHGGILTTISATAPNGGLNGEAQFVASSLKWL